MAENEEAGAPEKKGGMGKLLLVALVALLVGAGGGFVGLQKVMGESPPAPEAEGESGDEAPDAASEEEAAAAGAAFQERLLSLEPIIVNIAGDGYARLLKVRVEIECESKAVRDEAEARTPQIRDSVLTLVSSKRLADVTGFEGKALLKEDLLERLNQIVTTGRVESVLFTEFVVQ